MINPLHRRPTTPEEWRSRARLIDAHLDRWTLEDLLRGGRPGEPLHLGVTERFRHGYDPNQPRVPAGNPKGGQWTDKSLGNFAAPINDPRVISDTDPDNLWIPGAD